MAITSDLIVTDFKLGSSSSLWKVPPNMTVTLTFELDLDLDLGKFTKGQTFWNLSIKEN